jgi:hypothetical protein
MIKRVNFTGRRRIARTRVHIELFDGEPRTFSATIDLSELGFKPDAAVYLDAMCAGSSTVERFHCGEVGKLRPILNWPLMETNGENIYFTLKIVDRKNRFGRIHGIAENIRPEPTGKETPAGKRGILPIEARDLGEELWQLEFKSHDVFLLVNQDVPGLVERARTDPLFFAVVYPEVVRRVLTAAFVENADIEEDDDRWPIAWLKFGKALHPLHAAPPTGSEREEERQEWIEDVIEAFCKKHQMKSQYARAARGGER